MEFLSALRLSDEKAPLARLSALLRDWSWKLNNFAGNLQACQ
jgi:hypothetical protein